jgi:hypothetical protein
MTNLSLLPTPLARMLEVCERENADRQPFRAVHRLVDAIEVFAKLHTVAGVCAFSDTVLRADAHPTESIQLRVMLAAGLRTPSLGTWWQFARESARALRSLGVAHPLPGADDAILEKHPLRKAFDGNDNLIAFRNGYAHGATPSDAACIEDLKRVRPRLAELVERASWLRETEWLVRDEKARWWLARGLTPTLLTNDEVASRAGGAPLPTSGSTFLCTTAGLLALDPLLVHADGHAWFYNDLRDRHATLLNYPEAAHRKEPEARSRLLERFPLDQWRTLGGHELDPFRERIEALTEVFRGRSDELATLAKGLSKRRGFHVVWGPPGVGKSALLARFVQLCRWEPSLRAEAAPGVDWSKLPLPWPVRDDAAPPPAPVTDDESGEQAPKPAKETHGPVKVHVLEFFIRRGTNATAAQLFDSFNQRLDKLFGLSLPMGSTDLERRAHFDARLSELSRRLAERAEAGDEQRLVLVIDGLDEAPGSDDPLLSLLPRASLPCVRVVYGARPTQALKHAFYDELDREHRAETDLRGLGRQDTRALLYAHVDKYRLEEGWLDGVMTRSEGNPLYLRLLCQGLQDGVYKLGDALGLPADMRTLYTNALVEMERRTPGSTRLLSLLAAARDYVSPAMAAELLACDVGSLTAGPLATCRELLFENPRTSQIQDFQLFHESLREHLRGTQAADVHGWEEALADWCAGWKLPNGDQRHRRGERRAYAMRHAAAHLAASAKSAITNDQPDKAKERHDTLLALVEDAAWRAACFEACGDPGPLRQGFVEAQRILRSREQTPGTSAKDLLRLARWRHDEPLRLYEAQRTVLRTPVEGQPQAAHLERVVDLARMGARPRERVMLALTALWATASRPGALPTGLQQQVGDWLEEAREPALDKLWEMGGGR